MEEKDKLLLRIEIILGYISVISFLIFIYIASNVEMDSTLRVFLIVMGCIMFAVGVGTAVKIEQVAGFYQCSNCDHKYVPDYLSVFWAPHFGRTRYMKCPKCHTKSWNKKVLK